LPEPVIVVCETDGSGMQIGTSEEARVIAERMKSRTFSRPWLK
jgi:hypothetical protein